MDPSQGQSKGGRPPGKSSQIGREYLKKSNGTFSIDFKVQRSSNRGAIPFLFLWSFYSFGRRIFTPVRYHSCLIISPGSVMARWRSPEPSSGRVPKPYAPYVLAPNACTDHLLHAHAVTITPTQAQLEPQLPDCISTWFRARHATTKNAARSSRSRITWCRYYALVIFFRNGKR